LGLYLSELVVYSPNFLVCLGTADWLGWCRMAKTPERGTDWIHQCSGWNDVP